MSRPPQNLNLIDYAMAEAEHVFIGARFLLRERLQESRRRKIAQFIALTKLIPLRTHKTDRGIQYPRAKKPLISYDRERRPRDAGRA